MFTYILYKRGIIMTKNNVGELIRARRKQLRMSQEELATRTGYGGRSAINKIEKSVNNLPQEKILAFAQALQTTPVYLLGMVDDPEWRMPDPKEQQPQEDVLITNDSKEILIIETFRKADAEKRHLVEYLLGIK